MIENNLYFFTETCDKQEIISNLIVTNLGVPPTTTYCNTDTYEELINKINIRLKRKYPQSKIKWIWKVQSLFKNCKLVFENGKMTPNYSRLFQELQFTIEKKAEWYAKKYKNTRLSFQDFESALYGITYKAIDYYESWHDIETEFTLVETLELYWKTRMNSFIKSSLYTKKKRMWNTSLPLADSFDDTEPDTSPTPEQQYINKETMTAMFNDPSLTEKEKALLYVIYDNPYGSLRDWGIELGIAHPQTVKRLFQSLQRKLTYHNNS